MQYTTITSRENAEVKRYVKLATSRKVRYEERLFCAEGRKLVLEAVEGGCTPHSLYATQDAWGRFSQLSDLAGRFETVRIISDSVADKLSQLQSGQNVFAVFSMLDNGGQAVRIKETGKYFLVSSLQDPGNVGSILRSAAAFGIDGVFLSDDCPDIYSMKVLRAAMGGVFRLPVAAVPDMAAQIKALQKQGIRVCATALTKEAKPLTAADLGAGVAVVVGNEGNGLAQEIIDICDETLIIPIQPDSESLGVAVASAILLWEMSK